jgi:hypothetical protein
MLDHLITITIIVLTCAIVIGVTHHEVKTAKAKAARFYLEVAVNSTIAGMTQYFDEGGRPKPGFRTPTWVGEPVLRTNQPFHFEDDLHLHEGALDETVEYVPTDYVARPALRLVKDEDPYDWTKDPVLRDAFGLGTD